MLYDTRLAKKKKNWLRQLARRLSLQTRKDSFVMSEIKEIFQRRVVFYFSPYTFIHTCIITCARAMHTWVYTRARTRAFVYLPTPPSSLDKTRLIPGRIKRKRRCNGGRGRKGKKERELPVKVLKSIPITNTRKKSDEYFNRRRAASGLVAHRNQKRNEGGGVDEG